MDLPPYPPFRPHPLARGGHLQTVLGRYLPSPGLIERGATHRVEIGGGDALVVIEEIPVNWGLGDPCAILVHGLGGDARSAYLWRVAERLVDLGIRAIRVNLRNAGDGFGLCRTFYNAGLTGDLRRIFEWLAAVSPGSPIGLVGFSLGGNLALKLASEASADPVPGLDCVLAANPPLDLEACCVRLQDRSNRLYDQNFVQILTHAVSRLHAVRPELGPIDLSGVDSLKAFDEIYTAPRHGYGDAHDYYRDASAGPRLPAIEVPGLVVHARDDPFMPPGPVDGARFPAQLALEMFSSGGHLGYLARGGRWLDGRLARWLADRWGLNGPGRGRIHRGRPASTSLEVTQP